MTLLKKIIGTRYNHRQSYTNAKFIKACDIIVQRLVLRLSKLVGARKTLRMCWAAL
jgi:hypothetical protein